VANEFEYRRWNDEQMVAGWPKRERFTDRVVPHVVAALRPQRGERVLDVGSGGGKLSIAIGQEVGGAGRVTGADISAGMVAMATGRATEADAKNVSFLRADVQSETVPGGPFDAMTSQFGVMFFDEPVAAFSNIRRQLKPGGRIAFACWQPMARNTWFPGPAIAPFVPPPPPPAPGKSPTGPFALGDARATRRMLSAAGFVDIGRAPKSLAVWTPSDSVADDQQLTAVPDDRKDEARTAMARHFEGFPRRGDECRFDLNIQVFTARNP
jgi:SAM-dependent methyltransferase